MAWSPTRACPGRTSAISGRARRSAANYDDGSSFQIGRIDMVANTGTYLDSPFHRYADGKDLAELPLESLADLPGVVVRRPHDKGSRSMPRSSRASRCAAGRCWSTPAGTSIGGRTLTRRPPVPDRGRGRLAGEQAPRWSASTATTSTTRGSARGRCTRGCSAPESRSASICAGSAAARQGFRSPPCRRRSRGWDVPGARLRGGRLTTPEATPE